uniref:Uncharacterized protein n=1 Tax=Trichuris muris TaxID=70415 RepID=A0A5S6Q4B5_TRIMR
MSRYFDVDKFFAEVQNSKIQLDSLSDRLERLRHSIYCYNIENTEGDKEELPFRFRTNQLYGDVPAYARRFVHDWERKFRENVRKKPKPADEVQSPKPADNQLDGPPVVKPKKDQRIGSPAVSTTSVSDEIETLKAQLSALRAKGMQLHSNAAGSKESDRAPSELAERNRSPTLERSIQEKVLQPTQRFTGGRSPVVDRKRRATSLPRKCPSKRDAPHGPSRTFKGSDPRLSKRRGIATDEQSLDANLRHLQSHVIRQRMQGKSGALGARLPPVSRVVRESRLPPKKWDPPKSVVKPAAKSEDALRKIRHFYENRAPRARVQPVQLADAEQYPGFHYDNEAQNCVIENIRKRYFGMMGPNAMYKLIRRRELPAREVHSEVSATRKSAEASIHTSLDNEGTAASCSGNAFAEAATSNSSTSTESVGGSTEADSSTLSFKDSSPERSLNIEKANVVASDTDTANPSLVLNLESSSSESVATVQPSISQPPSPKGAHSDAPPKVSSTVIRQGDQGKVGAKTARTESDVSEIPLEANGGTSSTSRSLTKGNSAHSQDSWKTEEEVFGRVMVERSRLLFGKSKDRNDDDDDDLRRWVTLHMKALKAYFEVQVALLHCEKKIGYRKNAGEHAEYIDKRISNLRAKFERESQSLQGSVVSLVDEVREVSILQEKTVALQKTLAEMFNKGWSVWSPVMTPCLDEQKKLLREREAQAKRLIKQRKSLEKDAKVVATLESKAFKAWSTPAGAWKTASSLSSSSETPTNGNAKRQMAPNTSAEEDVLTPLSGRIEYSARIQSLKKELQQRRNVARRLTYEYNQRSKQHQISHERSLAKQIEIYEENIQKTERMISDLVSANSRGEVHVSPRMVTSGRCSARSARQLDALLEQSIRDEPKVDILNLEDRKSTSSSDVSQYESEAQVDSAEGGLNFAPDSSKMDVEERSSPSSNGTLSNVEVGAKDSPPSKALPKGSSREPPVGEAQVARVAADITDKLLNNVAAVCQDNLREWSDKKRTTMQPQGCVSLNTSSGLSASPEAQSDKPTVISTFDAISPRLLQSPRLQKATELPAMPFVPKLELHGLKGDVEEDGPLPLNADGSAVRDVDSYSSMYPLTEAPLISTSKEAVKAIVGVSVDCLLRQLAAGQSLWNTPKAAELYFVACELANHRRGNSERFDHLFREFIFDLCRDFIADIYGCKDKADCIGVGGPGCSYSLSGQMIKGNDELVKKVVDRLVLLSIFAPNRHARIEVVARRSWDDVDSRILSEMYDQEAAFTNLNAVEEEVLNTSADIIASRQLRCNIRRKKQSNRSMNSSHHVLI